MSLLEGTAPQQGQAPAPKTASTGKPGALLLVAAYSAWEKTLRSIPLLQATWLLAVVAARAGLAAPWVAMAAPGERAPAGASITRPGRMRLTVPFIFVALPAAPAVAPGAPRSRELPGARGLRTAATSPMSVRYS